MAQHQRRRAARHINIGNSGAEKLKWRESEKRMAETGEKWR
jgi:hypothetical protein